MSGRSYIVTGGAGFVGSNLAAELSRRDAGSHVVVVDSFLSGSTANLVESHTRAGVGEFRGSIVPEDVGDLDWAEMLDRQRPSAVFHLAAITDTTVMDERRMISRNLAAFSAGSDSSMLALCASRGVPLVYASSAATYGSPACAARREAIPESAAGRPNNVYGFSKWLMEQEHARLAARLPKAQVVGLRYFNVFGPGESRKGKMASMAYQLAVQMLDGKRPRLFADGSQARDQVYVDDVVDCTLHASGLFGGRPRPGVYNLGSGVATTFNEVVEGVRDGLGIAPASLPTDYFDMPASIRAFYQDYTRADMSRTAGELGWTPKHRPADAIRSYARYLKEHTP